MKKALAFFVFLVSSLAANAQIPNFTWAKSIGDSLWDIGYSIAVDGSGNVYTTGVFRGTVDFDPGAGVTNLSAGGSSDIFISKLNAFGNFVWAKNIGGAQDHNGNSIAVDKAGCVYTTGRFVGSSDFDPGVGVYNLSTSGASDIFISKLDSSGNFVWAKNFGGAWYDGGQSIVIDALANIYITGKFEDTADFDPGAGIFNLASVGAQDVFICKIDSSGNFVWAKGMGGALLDMGQSIAIDTLTNIYITGTFSGTADFDPSASNYSLASIGAGDVFISKLDAFGNFVWAKGLGGANDDIGRSIAVDLSGNVFTTGYFEGTGDFDPNAGVYNLSSNGIRDIFVSKLESSGNFVWAKSIGGPGDDDGMYICLDNSGSVYTTGYFRDTVDFDPNIGIFNLASIGEGDIFISKLDASGNFEWAKSIGGTSSDIGRSMVIDSAYNVYVTGNFRLTADFDPGIGIFNIVSEGGEDVFIHKMSQSEVGISENPNLQNNTIYPNPSNGLYTIELSAKSEITICNVIGEIILTQTMEAGKQALNLQQQANGIYFVRLVSEGKQEGFKLVKEE